jgi:type II secretion system protein N
MRLRQLFSGWICFGYFFYTVAVLLFMLWLQFPATAVKTKAEAELNRLLPAFTWQIGSISLTFPADIRFRQISLREKGNKSPLITLEGLNIRPDVAGWRKTGKWSVLYRLKLLHGDINGKLSLTKGKKGLFYTAAINKIQLDHPDLKKLLAAYQRQISGTLSGSVTGRQDKQHGLFAIMEGDITVTNGTISLQEPVLGMEKLIFDSLSSTISKKAGSLQFKNGKLRAKLLAAEFAGSLRVREPVFLSPVRIQGAFVPRPEFLASLGSPLLVNMLKRQLQEGKMPFSVSGNLQEPGIHFKGLPSNFNSLLQNTPKKP